MTMNCRFDCERGCLAEEDGRPELCDATSDKPPIGVAHKMPKAAKHDNDIVADRRAKRESPGPHFERTAQIWSAILGHPVSATQVVMCMVGLKLSRAAGQYDPDNMADVEGYASLFEEVKTYTNGF